MPVRVGPISNFSSRRERYNMLSDISEYAEMMQVIEQGLKPGDAVEATIFTAKHPRSLRQVIVRTMRDDPIIKKNGYKVSSFLRDKSTPKEMLAILVVNEGHGKKRK